MSKIYESGRAAATYTISRAFPEETISLWAKTIAKLAPPQSIHSVLDVGGGTGRFAGILKDIYGFPAVITDPSLDMLRRGGTESPGFQWIACTVEDMPFTDASFDLVFMSQVFHHIEDADKAYASIHRILTDNGKLIIRNGTKENDATMQWPKFFPEAVAFDTGRIPRQSEVVETLALRGFSLVESRTVHQLFASSWKEYYQKISGRGLSALIAISDEAFEAGLQRFKTWVVEQPDDEPVYEPVDIFLFQKTWFLVEPGGRP